jgi:hypothetical protein
MNKDTTPHGEETNRAQNKYRRRVKRVPERIYEHIKGAPTKAQPAAKTIGDRLSSAAADVVSPTLQYRGELRALANREQRESAKAVGADSFQYRDALLGQKRLGPVKALEEDADSFQYRDELLRQGYADRDTSSDGSD